MRTVQRQCSSTTNLPRRENPQSDGDYTSLKGRNKSTFFTYIDKHAAIQFRQVHEKNEFGDSKAAIKPFIIDLESTNGTIVNDEAIPPARYYELKLGDVIKFGESAREYVLLSEDAA
ncbi:hypothetical protein NM688_g8748 [Phlebia brevispora]|uniref:Uncharacterized protein n=1 Tax=Phlebia brevispora TaxID=194682 RepID=A0ACC1RQG1_9APHY|nr:hypothetical protein NM688_g8748 [Phlebia brevispora]